MKRIFYILLIITASFPAFGQLTNKFNKLESSFTTQNIITFKKAFNETFNTKFTEDQISIIDLFLEQHLLPIYPKSREITLFILDSIYYKDEHYGKCLNICKQILKKEENKENLDSIILIKLNILSGDLLYKNRERKKAIAHSQNALELINKKKPIDTLQKVKLLYDMNFMYRFSDHPEKTMKVLKEAEFLMSQSPNFDKNIKRALFKEFSKRNMGVGKTKEAEYYLNKAWEIHGKANGSHFDDPKIESSYLYENMYFSLTSNNINTAEKILQRADDYLQKKPKLEQSDIDGIAAVYNDYGELILNSNPKGAIPYYKKAMKINENGSSGFQVQYLFNLTKAYLYSDQFSEAEKTSSKLASLAVESNDVKLPFVHAMIGNIKLKQNNLEGSIKAFDDMVNAISVSNEKVSLKHDNIDAYEGTFYLHVVSGMYLKMAERLANQFPNSNMAKKAIFNLYHISLKQFIKSIENQPFNEKTDLILNKICHGLVTFHQNGITPSLPLEEMIYATEKFKSGYLWENFKQNNEEISIQNQEYKVKEQNLSNEIIEIKKAQAKEQFKELNVSLIDKEKELAAILYQRNQEHPRIAQFENFLFDFKKFSAGLPSELLILRYAIYNGVLYLYKISKNELDLVKIGDTDSISTLTSEFITLIRDPQSSIVKIQETAQSLMSLLIPFEINSYANLNFVPAGFLHYLPFELLRDEKYLINSHVISYAISLSLSNFSIDPIEISKIGLFAPNYKSLEQEPAGISKRDIPYNLQGSIDEVVAISEILPSESFTNEKASKSNFLKLGANYDILHFAMHSFTNDQDPELNSLVFSDYDDDNEFYLNELYFMKLNARLAVLSACNTGVVSDNNGEGIISMNRAFTYAGVPAVVSSLWSAPDQTTREIMVSFYTGIKQGLSKDKALRSAKLEYLENHVGERSVHPFYWAPFILHGDVSPFEIKDSSPWYYSSNALILISFFVMVMIVIGISRRIYF